MFALLGYVVTEAISDNLIFSSNHVPSEHDDDSVLLVQFRK
jgi:hypothetical protein